ncbi:hypothetical protein [Okeania sp. SIO2C2]
MQFAPTDGGLKVNLRKSCWCIERSLLDTINVQLTFWEEFIW